MRRRLDGTAALWAYSAALLVFLYLPLLPPLLLSLEPGGGPAGPQGPTLQWYRRMWEQPLLTASLGTSASAAAIVGLAAPLLGLLAAQAVRSFRARRAIVLVMVLPLFLPAVTMGLSTAFFLRLLGIEPSLLTIVLVHLVWALPFAFLIVLASMAGFSPRYLEAAYTCGAGPWRAFRDVELPLILPGLLGAALFSAILSFNETIRTTMVQGPLNTVQTYIWSTVLQIGLSPQLYALMGFLVLTTLLLVAVLIALALRRGREGKGGGPIGASVR